MQPLDKAWATVAHGQQSKTRANRSECSAARNRRRDGQGTRIEATNEVTSKRYRQTLTVACTAPSRRRVRSKPSNRRGRVRPATHTPPPGLRSKTAGAKALADNATMAEQANVCAPELRGLEAACTTWFCVVFPLGFRRWGAHRQDRAQRTLLCVEMYPAGSDAATRRHFFVHRSRDTRRTYLLQTLAGGMV